MRDRERRSCSRRFTDRQTRAVSVQRLLELVHVRTLLTACGSWLSCRWARAARRSAMPSQR